MIERKKRLHYTDPLFQDDSNDICTTLTMFAESRPNVEIQDEIQGIAETLNEFP